MGGGVGNGAPPQEALVVPYHLDFTDQLCVADYEHLQARCARDVVRRVASFAGRPLGIARDPADGRIYVCTLKHAGGPAGLWVVEPDGAVRALPLPAGAAPYGVAVRDGALWYADQQRNEIVRLPLPCAPTCQPEVVIPPADGLRNPQDLAWCDAGLLIADTSNHRIRLRRPDGSLETIAGTGGFGFAGDGGPAVAAQLAFPTGIAAVDPGCTVYVADTNNNRVRRFAPGESIETVAGSGQANPDKRIPSPSQDAAAFPISQPNDVAVDPATGTLFVSSSFDKMIYRVAPP